AAPRAALIPTGVQNLVEAVIDFIRTDIILQTIGPEGMVWLPFLLTIFTFVFVGNIFEVIPVIQMPVNARIAVPMFMAVVVWLIYNTVGVINQGPFGYIKSVLFPPGVPAVARPWVALIE